MSRCVHLTIALSHSRFAIKLFWVCRQWYFISICSVGVLFQDEFRFRRYTQLRSNLNNTMIPVLITIKTKEALEKNSYNNKWGRHEKSFKDNFYTDSQLYGV